MPILDIEFVGNSNRNVSAQELADAAGKILNSSPGKTWVTVRNLPLNQYAENGRSDVEFEPVFVSVLLNKLPELKERAIIAKELADAVATIFDCSKETVHVLFLPEGSTRIAFGGGLVRRSVEIRRSSGVIFM